MTTRIAMKTPVLRRVLSHRMLTLLILHVAVFCAAYATAILLRFDFVVPAEQWSYWTRSLPWCLAVKLWIFYCLGSFQGWWRYVTFSDLVDLLKAATLSTLCIVAIDHFIFEDFQVPRGLIVLDLTVTVLFFGALRASIRLVRELCWPMVASKDARRAIIVGADQQGEGIVRQMNADPSSGYRAVGFLDQDPSHQGSWLGGIPVLGSPANVARVAARLEANSILVVGDSLSGGELRKLMEDCRGADLTLRIVPRVEDIICGRYKFEAREVDINDLLHREPVELDSDAIGQLLEGRCVMVTGAGGSIGSEICRQVLKYHPKSMVLVEQFESGLFFIHNELRTVDPTIPCHPCIADILDEPRMEDLFELYRPDIVFHAAAHKHVPMMEDNPGEAVKNNVFGTQCVADLADRYDVKEFVLISTDKAVKPTSVMGVSKQLAERHVLSLAGTSSTKFVAVRFGNVLGSNGSVVPIFTEQIRRGGPITVTHPEMRRFFMTIPEASQLVLQAAAIGRGGEIFVLDMGELVRIVDLVRDMIRLSGLAPEDIAIEYTGIRPGEKLYEELQYDHEQLLPTSHPKVQAAYHQVFDPDEASQYMTRLRSLLGSRELLLAELRNLVPEYRCSVEAAATGSLVAGTETPPEASDDARQEVDDGALKS